MPTYLIIPVLAVAVFSGIFLWFIASARKTKIAFDSLMANPAQVLDFCKSGPDGDGYNWLHVRVKTGEVLVIGHFDVDEAEKRLHAAGVKQAD